MQINLSDHSASEIYFLMTQTIVPRPIAWILTENKETQKEDQYNLAPFSFFNALTSNPPTLIVSIGKKPGGEDKDTRSNLREGQRCVVHIPSSDQAAMVSASSKTLGYGDSELASLPLELEDFPNSSLPRIKECRIAFACKVSKVIEWGSTPQALILLEIEQMFIDDNVVTKDAKGRTKIDAKALDPLSRLGADEYASLGEIIKLTRPD